MIVLRLKKSFPVSFSANQDYQRSIRRIITRAEIPVTYSEGFSPHMNVEFTPPIPLGIESNGEYVAIDTALSREEVERRFSAEAPVGTEVISSYEVNKANISALTSASSYEIEVESGLGERMVELLLGESVTISYDEKGVPVTKEVRNKIISASYAGGKLIFLVKAGNDNLRGDRLLNFLSESTSAPLSAIDLIKTETYALHEGEYLPFDKFFGTVYEK